MAGVYTEETMRASKKNQIIDLFLKTQDKANLTIASLTAEIKRELSEAGARCFGCYKCEQYSF